MVFLMIFEELNDSDGKSQISAACQAKRIVYIFNK